MFLNARSLVRRFQHNGFIPAQAGLFCLAAAAVVYVPCAGAQAVPRMAGPVDPSVTVRVAGNTLPVTKNAIDLGRVPDSTPTGRVMLVLKPSAEQQSALDTLVAAQHNPASPSFHKWLKPADYARQFGLADADVQSVTSYLSSQGFNVAQVFPNKTAIEFSGTAGQIAASFHTEIHRYSLNGKAFVANDRDPEIPSALSPVVRGFASLNNYREASKGPTPVRKTGSVKSLSASPQYTDTTRNEYNIGPGDLAVLYDIPATENGSGVTVGVVNTSNLNLSYVTNYQGTFGLKHQYPIVIVDGDDPGENSNEVDAIAQLELIYAVAPDATVNYYTSASSDATTGINFAMIRAVDDDVIQVLLYDFESCESHLGAIGNAFNNALAEQASAEGISVIAASGNGGSDSCDSLTGYGNTGSYTKVTNGLSVNGYASTPFVTAVGATDFYYSPYTPTNLLNYWSDTNGGRDGYTSALQYIPEQPWNPSDLATNALPSNGFVAASGGGISTLGDSNDDTTASGPYPVPSWQIQAVSASPDPAVASSTGRVLPDVTLFGGNELNASSYILCEQADECVGGDPTQLVYEVGGGTSTSSAAFAGIAALIVQAHGAQGNLNPILYSLAQSSNASTIFHAPAIGTNTVACVSGSTDCGNAGYLVESGGSLAYEATTSGYNAATGLGSVDVKNLIADWASPATEPTSTSFTLTAPGTSSPLTTFVHGTAVQGNVSVTSSAGTPTGDVAIIANTPLENNRIPTSYTLVNGSYTDTTFLDGLAGGTYQLEARYAGAGPFEPSLSTPFTVKITPETSRIDLINFSNLSATSSTTISYGTSVSVGISVFSETNPNSIGQPTGSVSVFDNGGGTPLTIVPIDATGLATFNAQLGLGSHSLTFSYPGDPSYLATSTSQPLNVVVTAQPTGIVLSATSTSDPGSGLIELTALVSSTAGAATGIAPAGTVQFSTLGSGSKLLGTVILSPTTDQGGNLAGVASVPVYGSSLSNASASVQAVYTPSSSSSYGGSSSNVLLISTASSTGAGATTTTIATSDGASSYFDYQNSVSFNVSVASGGSGSVTPTGTVTVFINGVQLDNPVTLSGGMGTLAVSSGAASGSLPAPFTLGKDIVVAQYSGDANYAPSTSSITLTILDEGSLPDFSMQSDATYGTLTGSTPAGFTLQLTSLNNFAVFGNGVEFQATAPAGISCTFNPQIVEFDKTANYATSTMTCSAGSGFTVARKGPSQPPLRRLLLASGTVTFACLFMLGAPARRRPWQRFIATLVLTAVSIGMAMGLTACRTSASAASARASGTLAATTAAGDGRYRSGPAASGTLAAGTYKVIVRGTASFAHGLPANTTYQQQHTLAVDIVVE